MGDQNPTVTAGHGLPLCRSELPCTEKSGLCLLREQFDGCDTTDCYILITFNTFSVAVGPISKCNPSGGGPLAAEIFAGNSLKNASAKSRRTRSAMTTKPAACNAFR